MKYLAHTKDGKPCENEDECQELLEHLKTTALYAKERAAAFGASEVAEILALLHDVGKYSKDFQRRITGKTRAAAPHAMAGAYILKKVYGNDPSAEYYGIIIGSHHTGLCNWGTCSDMDDVTYFGKLKNYEEKQLPYDGELFLPERIIHKTINYSDKTHIGFKIATYLRMLFSVLVDSDFTDTEEFCTGIKRVAERLDAGSLFDCLMEKMPRNDGSIVNNIRAEILKSCLLAAEKQQGLFLLTVPTGGGKTLSSLVFALKHAKKHGLRRIIYVIPYTSIIEQNATIMRDKLGAQNVFEHHSGITVDGDDFRARWAAENWDIPIIVTTNVQFFESLFAAKTTKSRKIHNIAQSVIIFDEAQMLPVDYLSPCMAIISELIENYGVTAVLCSATQPCLHRYTYKNIKAVEIADNPDNLFERLKRVEFRFVGKKTDDEIVNELKGLRSALVVVNSRKHAFALFNLVNKEPRKEGLFYLSTLLTPAHRSEKIKLIKDRLEKNLPVTVISTQLIEAGVDVDFPVVYRSIAGIDSIIQAGGRANREGKLKNEDGSPKLGEVIVFEPVGDNGKIPRALETTVKIGKEVIDVLGDNSFGPEGVTRYFEMLYSTLERDDVMDKKGILDKFEMGKRGIARMDFETVAKEFKLIDEDTNGIVIDCPESKELIKSLRKGDYTRETIRELQKYSVSVYRGEFNRLQDDNALELIADGVYVLVTDGYYSEEKGIDIFTGDNKNGIGCFA